ncbi:MAG: glycoside hydrolase family 9 protein [Candidatus Coatesbacteria bacterium]
MNRYGILVAGLLVARGAGAAELKEVTIVDDRTIEVHIVDGKGIYSTHGKPVDEHVEQVPLDLKKAAKTGSWMVTGAGAYKKGIRPAKIGRKTKGRDYAIPFKPKWHIEWTLEHWIVIVLPEPMQAGEKYKIAFPGLVANARETEVVFDSDRERSEAVHVNQVGFVPEARDKYAYVSYWAGDLGGLPFDRFKGARFRLIDKATGRVAFQGTPALRKAAAGKPDGLQPGEGNHLRADLWECDFSEFRTPGEYVVAVDGVGRSYPFRIATDVYRAAFVGTMRGLYQQRCGTPLDPALTKWSRGLCHHPSLAPVHQSRRRMMEGHCDACKEVEGTDETRPEAWGGYHDAGDWDREGGHPEVPMVLCLAYELAPGNFRDGELAIPEAGNGLPDILDEARWSLDYWRRLQRPDGGVSLGLFLDHFPEPGQAADDDRGNWYVYAEDPEVSYQYAAAACRYAFCLGLAGKPADIPMWVESARKAWGWAETHQRPGDAPKIRDTRMHAAAGLFRATGEDVFHAAFKKDLLVTTTATGLWEYGKLDQKWAVWVYCRTEQADPALKKMLTEAAANWARRDTLEPATKRGLRYGYYMWIPLAWGITTVPQTLPLAMAYALTGDTAFRAAEYTNCDMTLGGNPLNLTWVTQLGSRWPGGVFQPDGWYHGPDGTVAPGIVPEGPHRFDPQAGPGTGPWDAMFVEKSAYPKAKDWPPLELYFEARTCFPMNEFVVAQIAQAAAAYGLLCAPAK